MDTVLYPDDRVQALLNEETHPGKVSIAESADLRQRFNVIWTPTFVLADGEGRAQQKICPGSLPAEQFLPVVLASLGRAYLGMQKYDEALRRFDRVVQEHERSLAAPEALYWRGVACYRKDDKDGLTRSWRVLRDNFPQSFWAQATSFLEKKQER